MAGTLYIVGTPIGNLEDITARALRILREVDLIAAEDTRVTRKLLSHFDIHTPLTSYHQHTRESKVETLIARLVEGQSIALVSDAGMPGISDPGNDLITAALTAGAEVVPIPGPNAAVSALVASGLSTSRFAFDGFPPRTKTDRRQFFDSLRNERRTIILYEAPGRVRSTLEELYAVLGDRPVAVGRELTKKFEEVYRGMLTGAIAHVREKEPRGEHTLVIAGSSAAPLDAEAPGQEDVEAALKAALDGGMTPRDAVKEVSARLKLPRRHVYSLLLDLIHNPG
jgi:16S rRNA (cytidine1402-2'-O)-methyltransferase